MNATNFALFLLFSTWFFPIKILAQSDQPPFTAQISPLPSSVRMLMPTRLWHPSCPVQLDQLAYVQLSYWGYDDRPHQGVIIVNKKLADEIVTIFRILYENRFPIGNMMPTYSPIPSLALPNNTESFNCRLMRGSHDNISLHSYGYAIDINPLANPEVRGQVVLPPEGRAYLDRSKIQKGMITEGDAVYQAFIQRGWQWGGNWKSAKDYMHFEKKQLLENH